MNPLSLFVRLTVLAVTTAPLTAQHYDVVDLGLLPGSSRSTALAIDEDVRVMGLGDWPPSTFVHQPTTGQVVLSAPSGYRFEGTAMNDIGYVLGSDIARNGSTQGIIAPNGAYTVVWPDIGSGGVAAINDALEVVGAGRFSSYAAEPFYWSPGTGIVRVTPGRFGSLVDINDRGEAIGTINGQHGIWTPTSFVPLTFEPEVINDAGQVAGGSGSTLMIYTPGQGTQSIPGFSFSNGITPCGMNDDGVIVGFWSYFFYSGSTQIWRSGPFLYTPALGLVEPNLHGGILDPAWEIVSLRDVNEHGQIAGAGRLRVVGIDWTALRLDPRSPKASSTQIGQGCGGVGGTPAVTATAPAIATDWTFALANGTPSVPGFVVFGTIAPSPVALGQGCTMFLDPGAPTIAVPLGTDPNGEWQNTIRVPPRGDLLGARLAVQVVLAPTNAPLGVDLSNGIDATIGF